MNRFQLRKIFITSFITLTLATCVLANTNQEDFDKGIKAQELGNWDQALEIYRDLISKDFSSGALFYNIANIYYRKGDRGNAVLWYERAKRQSPRDSDIKFNLSLSRSHIKNVEKNIVKDILGSFTSNELATITTVFIWLFFGFLSLVILKKIKSDTFTAVSLWSTGVLLLCSIAWLSFLIAQDSQPWAVITSPPGEVRNGPGTDYAVGFTVPEGSRVLLMNKRPKWTQIGVPQEGLKGWIPTREVEEIINKS